jgi:hypothetical protein
MSSDVLAKVDINAEGLIPPKDSDAKLWVRELMAW